MKFGPMLNFWQPFNSFMQRAWNIVVKGRQLHAWSSHRGHVLIRHLVPHPPSHVHHLCMRHFYWLFSIFLWYLISESLQARVYRIAALTHIQKHWWMLKRVQKYLLTRLYDKQKLRPDWQPNVTNQLLTHNIDFCRPPKQQLWGPSALLGRV